MFRIALRSTPRLALMALVAGLLLAGCATGGRDRQLQRLAVLQDVAGEPMESFHFWRLDRWEPLGRKHIAVWTRFDEAYLIQVDEPCSGLDFANAIGLTSTGQRVYRRFDVVKFDDQSCRIQEIRPIDVKALRAATKQAKQAPGSTEAPA